MSWIATLLAKGKLLPWGTILRLGGYVVLLLIGLYGGYQLGSARADRVELRVAQQLAVDLKAMTDARDIVSSLLTQELNTAHKELLHAQAATNNLLATNRRLRVSVLCPSKTDSGHPGMGNGERAELDPAARQAYFALRRGINIVENKLSTCQGILTVIQENKNEPK